MPISRSLASCQASRAFFVSRWSHALPLPLFHPPSRNSYAPVPCSRLYSRGLKARAVHTITKENDDSGPIDEDRPAQPLDKSVLERLTPTMRKFTCLGKVALITGGARGLGLDMAHGLAEAGCSAIALIDLQSDLGTKAAAELQRATGIPVRFYAADVTDEQGIAGIVNRVVEDLGGVHVVINSAGIVHSDLKAESYTASKFRQLIDVNLTGSFIVSQVCARHMLRSTGKEDTGSIVFISSIAGSRVLHPQAQCAYNASKAAVTQLAKSLAAEWAPHGIRVNTIAPGYVDTELNRTPELAGLKEHWKSVTPMGRLGRPDDLNCMAVYLASEASAFVTGAHYYVDGGYAIH